MKASVEQLTRRISEGQERLAEKAKKLASLKALLLDPDLSEYVAEFAPSGKNGTGKKQARNLSTSKRSVPNATGLRAAIQALSFKAPFTVAEAIKALIAQDFDFRGREPEQAVRDSLYVLAKEKKGIRLATKGWGGKPNQYEKTT